MGQVIELPRRRVVRKRARSGVKFDASRLLREYERRRGLSQTLRPHRWRRTFIARCRSTSLRLGVLVMT